MRRSLNIKGPPQQVSLVEIENSTEREICCKSVDLEEDNNFDWSDTSSVKSFMTHQPRRKKKATPKTRIFDQIQKVLDFGSKAKQITRTKLFKNPTIEKLKNSAIKEKQRQKHVFNLSKMGMKGFVIVR